MSDRPPSTLPFAQTTPGPAGGTDPTQAAPSGTLDLPAADRVEPGSGLEPGRMIGRFVVRSRLGEGGMGIVLAGHDADLGRAVAIKLVKSEVDHPAYRARLLREAQAMARLEHPNVARVYEVGSDHGRLFVAMEFIDGMTLAKWLVLGRRTAREVLAMFEQVGAGLAAVHRAGLIHRDFKPDNVLVDRDARARVVDFGLARLDVTGSASPASPELAAQLTRTGVAMGTPGYMAPEQQFGAAVDARVDQYSFCVALREALLGGRARDDWRDTPRAVRDVIARGLAYDPEERYASMDALLADLYRRPRRGWWIAGGIAAAIAAAVVVIVATRRPDAAPAPTATGSSAGSAAVATPPPPRPASPPPSPMPTPTPPVSSARDATAKPSRAATVTAPPKSMTIPPSAPGQPQRAPRLPAAYTTDPGHLPLVRATLHDLGYDGYDAAFTAEQAKDRLGAELGIANVKLGLVERRRSGCSAAMHYFREASQQLASHIDDDEAAWAARAYTNLAICALGAGDKQGREYSNRAWGSGNRAQLQLVLAVAAYEEDDMRVAQGLFTACLSITDPAVQSGIRTWLAGTGLKLP